MRRRNSAVLVCLSLPAHSYIVNVWIRTSICGGRVLNLLLESIHKAHFLHAFISLYSTLFQPHSILLFIYPIPISFSLPSLLSSSPPLFHIFFSHFLPFQSLLYPSLPSSITPLPFPSLLSPPPPPPHFNLSTSSPAHFYFSLYLLNHIPPAPGRPH